MRTRSALLVMGAALLSLPNLPAAENQDTRKPDGGKPNIVCILVDDLGRGDYSAFGTRELRTPHIDRLFREGMTFDNFYANSPVCSPTRAALLTGCYPDRVGVPGVIRDVAENSWVMSSTSRNAPPGEDKIRKHILSNILQYPTHTDDAELSRVNLCCKSVHTPIHGA